MIQIETPETIGALDTVPVERSEPRVVGAAFSRKWHCCSLRLPAANGQLVKLQSSAADVIVAALAATTTA